MLLIRYIYILMKKTLEFIMERKVLMGVLILLSAFAIYQFGIRVGEFIYLVTH